MIIKRKDIIDYKNDLKSIRLLKTNGSKKIDPLALNKPLISIITIVHNAEETIEKTILSVNNQSYKNFEYIIVDGLSSDNTVKIIKRYDTLISKWISEKDDGALDAIGRGIAMAKGEIIFLLSADDWITEDTLDAINDGFNVNEQSSFIYGDMIMVSKNKQIIVNGDIDYKVNIKKGIPKFNYPTLACRRLIYENLGLYTTTFPWNADYEYLIRIFKNDFEGSYVEKFKVFRTVGGKGESNMFAGMIDTLLINYHHNLPVFMPSIRIFSSAFIIYLKITLSKFKKVLIK